MFNKQELEFLYGCVLSAKVPGTHLELGATVKSKIEKEINNKQDNRKYDDIANEKLKESN